MLACSAAEVSPQTAVTWIGLPRQAPNAPLAAASPEAPECQPVDVQGPDDTGPPVDGDVPFPAVTVVVTVTVTGGGVITIVSAGATPTVTGGWVVVLVTVTVSAGAVLVEVTVPLVVDDVVDAEVDVVDAEVDVVDAVVVLEVVLEVTL